VNVRTWIGLVLASGLCVVVAMVMLRGGGVRSSPERLARATLLALERGDADALDEFADTDAVIERALDCAKPPRNRDQRRKRRDAALAAARGTTLELVAATRGPLDLAVAPGDKTDGCVAKRALSRWRVELEVDVARDGSATARQQLTMKALELDGEWYLVEPPLVHP
jgi:hypothetical protein